MPKRIAIIQGHPDSQARHFDHALADAYADGARQAGHEVREIAVAMLDFPLLRTQSDWEQGETPSAVREAQGTISWADHLVIVYPLWLGTLPALLKGFFEQALRPGFAFDTPHWQKRLTGKSARIVVTMGMPAFVYRWYYRAHGLKNLQRNVLGFCGIHPVRASMVGMIGSASETRRGRWLERMRSLGSGAR